MVRRYHESVEVQSRPDPYAGSPDAPAPSAFVWRGRLYVVREVLDHWRERRAWWREALGPDPDQTSGQVSGPPGAEDLERDVWRVEASAGRCRGSGVYDLVGSDPGRGWRLVRVAD